MKTGRLKWASMILWSGLLLLTSGAWSQARPRLTGHVLDAETGRPLVGANVMVQGTVLGAATGLDGRFRISGLRPGEYTLMVSMIGYARQDLPFRFEAGGKEIEIRLLPAAVQGETVVVTASKRQQPLETTPISVDVVRGADIQARNVVSVDEVLANTAGIGVIDGQIDIRGSTGFNWTAGSRVLLLLDGHPFINGDTGGINWDAIPPEEIDHVEVVKGAGSALYGSSAMAGVVNIITRSPSETPETRFKLGWGFFDEPAYAEWRWTDRFLTTQIRDGKLDLGRALSTQVLALSHSRKIGPTGLGLHLTRRTSDGYQQNGREDRWNLMAKTHTDLGGGRLLNVTGGWSVNDHGDFLQWAGQDRALEVPEEERGNTIRYAKAFVNADYRQVLGQKLGFTAKVHGYWNDWKNDYTDNQDQAQNRRLGAELQWDWITGGHTLTSGVEGVVMGTDSDIYGDRIGWDGAIYAEDQWRVFPRWTVTLGSRFDLHHVKDLGTDSQVSPRVGAVGQVWQGGLWRFTAGRGFRAPSIAEVFAQISVSGFDVVPNLELKKAERAWSLETGLHQVMALPRWPLAPQIELDAALFFSRYDDMIDVRIKPGSTDIQFDNIGAARIWGAETRADLSLWQRRVDVQLGYTRLFHENLETGDPLTYRPAHRFNTGVKWNWRGLFLGWDYRYASRAEAVVELFTDDPRVPMHVMDVRLGVHWKKFRITLETKNLRNYHYTLRQRQIEPVRQFLVTLDGTL